MERLDQGCCSQEWQKLFPKARILHLIAPYSDHKPIRMDTTMEFNNQNRPYGFEVMSIQDPSCVEVVEKAQRKQFEGFNSYRLMRKFYHTSLELKRWNKYSFGHVKTRIIAIEKKIEKLQHSRLATHRKRIWRRKPICSQNLKNGKPGRTLNGNKSLGNSG